MAIPSIEELNWASAFCTSFVLVFALLLPVFLLREDGMGRGTRTLVVLGSGGHTTEMLSMLTNMPKAIAAGSVFVIAATDTMSQAKLDRCFPGADVRRTPRAREVRQSWFTRFCFFNSGVVEHVKTRVALSFAGNCEYCLREWVCPQLAASPHPRTQLTHTRDRACRTFCSVFTTFVAAVHAFRIVFAHQPDLVMCNGPGTCVPIAYAAWLMRTLRIKSCAIVFTVLSLSCVFRPLLLLATTLQRAMLEQCLHLVRVERHPHFGSVDLPVPFNPSHACASTDIT